MILRINGQLEIGSPTTPGTIYSFPTSDGSSGQVMITNGSGSLSWFSPATPPVSPWQYNSGTNDIYTTTDNVGIGTSSPAGILHLSTGSAEAKALVIDNTNSNGTGIEIDMNATNQNISTVKGIISEAQPKAYAGYFDGRLETTTVFNLEEKSAAPSNVNSYAGDIYMDDGSNTNDSKRGLRYYDGTNWEDTKEGIISFNSSPSSTITIVSGTTEVFENLIEKFDTGNNFDPTTGEFTVPSDGIYQFNLKLTVDADTDLTDKIFNVKLLVNGSPKVQHNYLTNFDSAWASSYNFTSTKEFSKNDVIKMEIYSLVGVDIEIKNNSTTRSEFSGFKIK